MTTVGLLVAAIVVGSATVISGVAHRIGGSWQPQGDDAIIAWRSHDVFTSSIPLLGMPSTVGGLVPSTAHHWGPLQFWILSVPQWLAGNDPVGLQIGLLVVALASITGIAAFTFRRVGLLGSVALLALLVVLQYSLGRHILSSVWNPDIAVLPLAFLMVLAWSVAAGDRAAVPFLVLASSFVVQSNILYTPIVAALVAWSIIGFLVVRREQRRSPAEATRPRRRWWIAALIVFVVCWSGPIIFELTHSPGNIERVLTRTGEESGQHVGLARATNTIAHGIGVVPLWGRQLSSLVDVGDLYSTGSLVMMGSAVAIVLVLVGGWWWMWKRDAELRALLGAAVFSLVGGTIGVARLPWLFGATYRLWTVWLVGMLAWFAIVVFVWRTVPMWLPRLVRGRTVRGVVPVAAVVVSAVLVGYGIGGAIGSTPKFMQAEDRSDAVARLVKSITGRLPSRGPFLAVQNAGGVGTAVLWGLQRRGYDIRISKKSPIEYPHLGSTRDPGRRSLPRLYLYLDLPPEWPTQDGLLLAATKIPATAKAGRDHARAKRDACRLFAMVPPRVTSVGREIMARARPRRDATLLTGFARHSTRCELIEFPRIQDLVDRRAVQLDADQTAELLKLSIAYFAAQDHRYEVRVSSLAEVS